MPKIVKSILEGDIESAKAAIKANLSAQRDAMMDTYAKFLGNSLVDGGRKDKAYLNGENLVGINVTEAEIQGQIKLQFTDNQGNKDFLFVASKDGKVSSWTKSGSNSHPPSKSTFVTGKASLGTAEQVKLVNDAIASSYKIGSKTNGKDVLNALIKATGRTAANWKVVEG